VTHILETYAIGVVNQANTLISEIERIRSNNAMLLNAAKFTLHHVIAGLSAGTPPEPQMLAAAHSKLFQAIKESDPSYYGAPHAGK